LSDERNKELREERLVGSEERQLKALEGRLHHDQLEYNQEHQRELNDDREISTLRARERALGATERKESQELKDLRHQLAVLHLNNEQRKALAEHRKLEGEEEQLHRLQSRYGAETRKEEDEERRIKQLLLTEGREKTLLSAREAEELKYKHLLAEERAREHKDLLGLNALRRQYADEEGSISSLRRELAAARSHNAVALERQDELKLTQEERLLAKLRAEEQHATVEEHIEALKLLAEEKKEKQEAALLAAARKHLALDDGLLNAARSHERVDENLLTRERALEHAKELELHRILAREHSDEMLLSRERVGEATLRRKLKDLEARYASGEHRFQSATLEEARERQQLLEEARKIAALERKEKDELALASRYRLEDADLARKLHADELLLHHH